MIEEDSLIKLLAEQLKIDEQQLSRETILSDLIIDSLDLLELVEVDHSAPPLPRICRKTSPTERCSPRAPAGSATGSKLSSCHSGFS